MSITAKPFFKASLTNSGNVELMVYDAIGKQFDGSGVSATDIKNQLDQAGKYTGITLRINSPGGDAFEGVAIYNMLRATKKPITTCIDGLAASSASIIAMAGDVRTMGSNAVMMIHDPYTVAVGNAGDMRKTADSLDVVSKGIAQTYVDTTGLPLDKVQAMMNAETWMNADEAIQMGFATGLNKETDEQAATAMALARGFQSLQNMKSLPDVLKAPVKNDDMDDCQCSCKNCVNDKCEDCINADCDYPGCEGCPNQSEEPEPDPAPETLSAYEAQNRLNQLRIRYI